MLSLETCPLRDTCTTPEIAMKMQSSYLSSSAITLVRVIVLFSSPLRPNTTQTPGQCRCQKCIVMKPVLLNQGPEQTWELSCSLESQGYRSFKLEYHKHLCQLTFFHQSGFRDRGVPCVVDVRHLVRNVDLPSSWTPFALFGWEQSLFFGEQKMNIRSWLAPLGPGM